MHEELAPHNFTVVGVAVDESPDHARPWVEEAGCTFPMVYDRDHSMVEAYGVINVPTVIWVDEDDRIVRPHDSQFPNDNLLVFHGRESGPHLEALRRWVIDGEAPMAPQDVKANSRLPSDDDQLARAHYRLAVELLRRDALDAAVPYFERAGALAPDDWTIRRASLLLTGKDPFLSEEFIEMFTAARDKDQPVYKLR